MVNVNFMQSGTTGRHKSVMMTHDNVSLPAPANMSELVCIECWLY